MGSFNSTEIQSDPPLLDQPWRVVPWGNNGEILQYVQNYKPAKENIKNIRILLYGPVGAGKSCFINSVSNVIRRRMTNNAAPSAITSDKSFTIQYRTHSIQIGRGADKKMYPVVFNDIMGLEYETDQGVCPADIKLIMKGHVREGYEFKPESSIQNGDPYYNSNPAPEDKVHALVCVLSANVAEIKKTVLEKMNLVRETARDLGIPQIAIMTNIDEACPVIEKDLRNVYRSRHLQDKIRDFSSAVGIQLNYIFPVKNYSKEIDLNNDVDTLILSALKHMINFGDDFMENM